MKKYKEMEAQARTYADRYNTAAAQLKALNAEYDSKLKEARADEQEQYSTLEARKSKAVEKASLNSIKEQAALEEERKPLLRDIEKIKTEAYWYDLSESDVERLSSPEPRELDHQAESRLRRRLYQCNTQFSHKVKQTLKVGRYNERKELSLELLQMYMAADALCEQKILNAKIALAEEVNQICEKYDDQIADQRKKWETFYATFKKNYEKKKSSITSTMLNIATSKELDEIVRSALELQRQEKEPVVWNAYSRPKTMPPRLHFSSIYMDLVANPIEGEKPSTIEYAHSLKKRALTLPVQLDLFRSNIVVVTTERNNAQADGADKLTAQRILAQMIRTIPPENCCYNVLDLEHKGQALGRLIDLENMNCDLKFEIFTEKDAASDRRMELAEQSASLIREMAGRSRSLFEYNKQEFRHSFTWYVDMSFPDAPDDQMKAELTELIKTSNITGTSFLFVTSSKGLQAISKMAKVNPGISLYHLNCSKLSCAQDAFSKNMAVWTAPSSRQLSDFVQAVKTYFEKGESMDTRLGSNLNQIQKRHFAPFSEVLSLPFARDSRGNLLEMKLGGKDGVHGFISGDTGCGKSTLLHSIILGACRRYPPSDLQIWMADYKMTDFALYKTNTPPHIRFIGVSTAEEFTYGLLDKIEAEALRRVNLFNQFGVKDLGQYRTHADEPGYVNLPVLLIIIDEFQIMSQTVLNDSFYKDKLENALRLYRAHGIRFLLASQTFAKGLNGLSEAAKDQIGIRLALRNKSLQDVKDSLETSAPYTDAMVKAIELMDPGDIIMARNLRDAKGKLTEIRLEKYRGLFVSDEDIHTQLAEIRKSYDKVMRVPDPLYINTNIQVPWDPKDMDALDRMEPRRSTEMRLYLGRCDLLRPCFGLDLLLKNNENVSIVGGRLSQRWELITSVLKSCGRNGSKVYIFLAENCDLAVDHGDALRRLCAEIPNAELKETYDQWCWTLSDLAELALDRSSRQDILCLFLGMDDAWEELSEFPDYETVYERISRQMLYADPSMPVTVNEEFNAIPLIEGLFDKGPRRGIHCVTEAGTYDDFSRLGTIGDKCCHRIAFHMTVDECLSYLGSSRHYNNIGNHAACSSGGNTAPRLIPYQFI